MKEKREQHEEIRHKEEEREKLGCVKRQKEIIGKAEKRKAVLDNNEKELNKDENKLNEEYELLKWMLEDAKKSLDRAIDASEMLEVKIAQELTSAATKILNEAPCHRAEQTRIRADIAMKHKCVCQ